MSTTNISEARLAANRANAQKSTGPVTDAGKLASSLNAHKHGFTGRLQLLSEPEALAYAEIGRQWVQDLRPIGILEDQLVRMIHDAAWQLNRLQANQQEVVNKLGIDCPRAGELCRDFVGAGIVDRLARYQTRIERGMHHAIDQLRKEQAARAKRTLPHPQPVTADRPAKSSGGSASEHTNGFVWKNSASWNLYNDEVTMFQNIHPNEPPAAPKTKPQAHPAAA